MKQESSAINPYNGIFGQQGWICPKCGRVYSPYTQMCLYCKPDNITTISNLSDLSNKNVSEEELRENRKTNKKGTNIISPTTSVFDHSSFRKEENGDTNDF